MGFNLPEDFLLISLILSNTFTKRSKYVYAWDKYVCVPALRSDHVILREHLPCTCCRQWKWQTPGPTEGDPPRRRNGALKPLLRHGPPTLPSAFRLYSPSRHEHSAGLRCVPIFLEYSALAVRSQSSKPVGCSGHSGSGRTSAEASPTRARGRGRGSPARVREDEPRSLRAPLTARSASCLSSPASEEAFV